MSEPTIYKRFTDLGEEISSVDVPVGTMAMYCGSSIPSGWLLCNGSTVSRTTYADLYAAIGTTWGSGDGSSTFAVPDMRNVFPMGVGNNSLGVSVSAGLPQISGNNIHSLEGYCSADAIGTSSTSGCWGLSYANPWYPATQSSGNHAYWSISIQASRSSSIYSASSTVQPPAKAVYYAIKALMA